MFILLSCVAIMPCVSKGYAAFSSHCSLHFIRLVTSRHARPWQALRMSHQTAALPQLSLWSNTVTSRTTVHSYLVQYVLETFVLQCPWFTFVFVEFRNRINAIFICVNPLNMCNELLCDISVIICNSALILHWSSSSGTISFHKIPTIIVLKTN